MSKKILVPVVLVLVATLGAFFAVNSQLTQQISPQPSQGMGTLNIQFASTGLDTSSQAQANGQGQGQGQTNGQGHNKLNPSSISDIVIRFTKVEIHAANSTGNDGWTTLNVPETTVDFAHPASVDSIINGASLPAGKYNIIRLFTDHVTISIRSGESLVQLTRNVPSGKIDIPIVPGGFDLASNGTVNVTLTFTFNVNEVANNPKNFAPLVKAQVS